jgi:hypothetical protein
MKPHREKQKKALEPSAPPKPKRFRIVKLEERIAPKINPHGKCVGPGHNPPYKG